MQEYNLTLIMLKDKHHQNINNKNMTNTQLYKVVILGDEISSNKF